MIRKRDGKMGFYATWSMAVAGMLGGGIFTILGVVSQIAGGWAWLSLLLAAGVAAATGYSYATLSVTHREAGGAFRYLRHARLPALAGGISWIVIAAYTIAISVYGYMFGHYFEAIVGGGERVARIASAVAVLLVVGVDLAGVRQPSPVRIATVWVKLGVLAVLGVAGLAAFAPDAIAYGGASPGGPVGGLVGAASVFMTYEGFQLLSYDYRDVRRPTAVLKRATLSAIAVVAIVYLMVALGAQSLVGTGVLAAQEEVSIALAGQAAFGETGRIAVSLVALLAAVSAIDATLFATARLSARVAAEDDLPGPLEHDNRHGMPDRMLATIGVTSALLAFAAHLSQLVQAASLAFLFTFTVVNVFAFRERIPRRLVSAIGAGGAATGLLTLAARLAITEPLTLTALLAVGVAAFGRQYVRRRFARGGS